MNQINALQRLQQLGVPVIDSRDASAVLDVTASNATTILRRLARSGLITHLSRGRWLLDSDLERFALPEAISTPAPAYVSLQSALFHHGLIEQIPAVIYAVTIIRTHRVTTPFGTISYHRMPPELFDGFELSPQSSSKIATAEKALFDLLYLGPGRSRLFSGLPELSLPRRFRWQTLRDYAARVSSPARRAYILRRIAELTEARSTQASAGRIYEVERSSGSRATTFEETQETPALQKLLAIGNQDIAAGKIKPVAEVVTRLRAKRTGE